MYTKIHRDNAQVGNILCMMPRCFLGKVVTEQRRCSFEHDIHLNWNVRNYLLRFSSYLRGSPVVCADGDYPFSNIHVTPRISSSISRSARCRVDGSTQVCFLPKVAGGRVLPSAAATRLEEPGTLLCSLDVAFLVGGGLAGSPRRKALDALPPHSRELPRCAFESECGNSRGGTRSTGRLVQPRRHEVDAKTLRHGVVACVVIVLVVVVFCCYCLFLTAALWWEGFVARLAATRRAQSADCLSESPRCVRAVASWASSSLTSTRTERAAALWHWTGFVFCLFFSFMFFFSFPKTAGSLTLLHIV